MIKYKKEAGGEAMNIDTTIGKNIRVADEKASYDAACKRLLSEKIILFRHVMDKCKQSLRNIEDISRRQ